MNFTGSAMPLNDAAIAQAASKLGCQIAAVRAVIDVESAGGFLPDTRPKILFERHYFSRLTNGVYDRSHPDISHPKWGGYKGGKAEYDRLERAIALNREAALRSASWGSFQIMGDNYRLAGFPDVETFVKAMVSGAPAHLDAFVGFVRSRGLADELASRDWAGFARGYNGPGYKANRYDEKLAAQFLFHSRGGSRTNSPMPVLRLGDEGEEVSRLQTALGITADGDFGPATKSAVIAFQTKNGLHVDGIVGQGTWQALGLT